ncbi:Gfo/Idh/MocA family protein [Liquorilactobacillus sicerae]|uniref:Gfo/Idh/MocA family protein n=1 Tax=Liquorilactobacillus sicerae TaxID=1416943 RepID=UPI0024819431|nr:Gfo/Idh/MocA family oxidoreductase [Liquorilactobacillus sicerae]
MAVRYGIIGDEVATQRLAAAIEASQTGILSGVVGNSTVNQQLAQLNPQLTVFSDQRKLLTADLDVIYLAADQQSKFELAKQGLLNNKNLLIEKPLTRHFIGANEILRLAKQQNLLVFEDFSPLFSPLMQQVKALVAQKIIGDLRFIDVKLGIKNPPVWFTDLSAGGGALFHSGSMIVALIQSLCGHPITQWQGLENSQIGQADSSCNLVFKAKNILSNVLITAEPGFENEIVLYGTDGKIKVLNFDQQTEKAVLLLPGRSKNLVADQQTADNLVYLLDWFDQCLAANNQDCITTAAKLILSSRKVIESLYQQWYGDPLN